MIYDTILTCPPRTTRHKPHNLHQSLGDLTSPLPAALQPCCDESSHRGDFRKCGLSAHHHLLGNFRSGSHQSGTVEQNPGAVNPPVRFLWVGLDAVQDLWWEGKTARLWSA